MTTEVITHEDQGPYPGGMDGEVIVATVDTNETGDGGLTGISLLGRYSDSPVATIDSVDDGDEGATIANKTADSLDIEVSGSNTTGGTVLVRVLVWGPTP